ncbi:MAG: hypothetical protein IIX96_03815 [Clostridia bacterium]|nr:hypothetical protein [Clostridia bacterium]
MDITLIYDGKPTVTVSFTAISLTLKNFSGRLNKIGIRKRLMLAGGFSKGSTFLIKHSKIHLSAVYLNEADSYTKTAVISHGTRSMLASLIISLLESNAKSLTVANDAFITLRTSDSSPYVSFTVKTTLACVLISFFLVIFTLLKKEKFKLGKQNE